MKIYTKGGDNGHTELIGGKRVAKNNFRIVAYGNVDELLSNLALLKESYKNEHFYQVITKIQSQLMNISAILSAGCSDCEIKLPKISNSDIRFLENEIDEMENGLPPLKNFIIPGGNSMVAVCHICRTVCRRVERSCLSPEFGKELDNIIIPYINRLSDFLFVLSRQISKETNAKEIPWIPEL